MPTKYHLISPYFKLGSYYGGVVPTVLGTLIENDFDSGNWSSYGSPSATFSGDGITFATKSTGLQDYIYYKTYTDLDQQIIPATFLLGLSDPYIFFGFGPRETHGSGSGNAIALEPDGTVRLFFVSGILGSDLGFAGPGIPVVGSIGSLSAGDLITLSMTTNVNIVSFSAQRNSDTPVILSYDTNYFTFGSGYGPPTIAAPFIINVNAKGAKLTSWSLGSTELKNVDRLAVGDSWGKGFNAGSGAARWAKLANMTVNAGGSEFTSDVINKLPQIILQNPKKVFLIIGINDKANGVSDATWQANIITVDSTLMALGITVVHVLYGGYGANGIAVNSFKRTQFPTRYIDTQAALESSAGVLNAIFNSGDGHPNADGHTVISNTIISSPLY